MSQLPNVNSPITANSNDQAFGAASALNDVDLDDFLNLMLAELQNQDPLNPLENDELIAQISQIREVGATEQLTETLEAVLLGQNIASATNLIGAQVEALSDDSQRVTGIVERIQVDGGEPKLHLDLSPSAEPSDEQGEIEAGAYQYRVVWRGENNTLFGVDPLADQGGEIELTGTAGKDQSVLISNLPTTNVPKQIYRKEGDGNFRLVAVINDTNAANYLDTTSTDNLATGVMPNAPQLVTQSRQYTVSLRNVAEIRPPGS